MMRRCVIAVLIVFAVLFLSASSRAAPALPSIPARSFPITDYGAKPDGVTKATDAIRAAVAACGKAGGGSVVIPAGGRFLTGPFELGSDMALRVERGAVLLLSDDPKDFRLEANRYENAITARPGAHDIAVTGEGTIDGQGRRWWTTFLLTKNAAESAQAPHRPFLIVLDHCTRVLVEGVTLRNSPMFHLVPQHCVDVTIRGIRIEAPDPSPNTDGIDPSGRNYLITGCTFDMGDDCIALKPSGAGEPGHVACEDFLIEHCRFLHGHGMSIGGQTPGGLRRMTVRDCTFEGTDAGIRMKAARGSGGLVEHVRCENLTMRNVKVAILITSYYPRIPKDPAHDAVSPVTPTTPIWRNIHIENVTAESGETAGQIIGLPEMLVQDVTLKNVRISARKGLWAANAKHIHLIDTKITAAEGKAVIPENAVVDGTASAAERSAPAPPLFNVTVAADGKGRYRSVQDAIDAAPVGSPASPAIIHIKPGTYREALHVPTKKSFLHLIGEDATKTVLTFNKFAGQPGPDGKPIGTFRTASTVIDADDFSAENVTFENSAGPKGQALALRIEGDRATFRRCRFVGWQDTILDNKGRHFYDRCEIAGAVDFIFGAGTSWFEQCRIRCLGSGFITAASTPEDHVYGYVFNKCVIEGASPEVKTHLGRPWRDYASVIFLDTEMDASVRPAGWRNWDKTERDKTARCAEFNSHGPGAGSADVRVPWAKRLSSDDAAKVTPALVLGGWNP